MIKNESAYIALLQGCKNFEETFEVLLEFTQNCPQVTYISSHPVYGWDFKWPSKIDHGKCYIRSVFAHDKIFIINQKTLSDVANNRISMLSVDYSISMDSNVAIYLRSKINGKNNNMTCELSSVLNFLHKNKFNWDLTSYIYERHMDLVNDLDEDSIFDTIRASELYSLSQRRTDDINDLKLKPHDFKMAERKARMMVEGAKRILSNEDNPIRVRFNLYYVCVLKMCTLQKLYPKENQFNKKMVDLINWMCQELNCNVLAIMLISIKYFKSPTSFKLTRKFSSNNQALIKSLRNATWDIVHILGKFDLIKSGRGGRGKVFIPYLMTFDEGLVEVLEFLKIKGIILSPNLTEAVPIYENSFLDEIGKSNPSSVLRQTLEGNFSYEQFLERKKRKKLTPSELEALIKNMENFLITLP